MVKHVKPSHAQAMQPGSIMTFVSALRLRLIAPASLTLMLSCCEGSKQCCNRKHPSDPQCINGWKYHQTKHKRFQLRLIRKSSNNLSACVVVEKTWGGLHRWMQWIESLSLGASQVNQVQPHKGHKWVTKAPKSSWRNWSHNLSGPTSFAALLQCAWKSCCAFCTSGPGHFRWCHTTRWCVRSFQLQRKDWVRPSRFSRFVQDLSKVSAYAIKQ